MSEHKITAIRSGHTNGMDWEAEYTITFGYVRGSRDYWNKAGGHWEQGWGPEIEYISHEPVSNYGPAAENEADWCSDWLYENEAACMDGAEHDLQPDPDYARDLAIEDRLIRGDDT
jgi:hypothetical protein